MDNLDLFITQEELPKEIQDLITEMELGIEDCGNTYTYLGDYFQKFKELGYTFEYDLDAIPYNLQKDI